MKKLFVSFILLFFCNFLHAQTLLIDTVFDNLVVTPYLSILEDTSGQLRFGDVHSDVYTESFQLLQEANINHDATVHWLKFNLQSNLKATQQFKLIIAFADSIQLYVPNLYGNYERVESGDMYPLSKRDLQLGVIVGFDMTIYPKHPYEIYVRVQSSKRLSQKARHLTLNSFKLFSADGFHKRFEEPRYYQALFYGALLIMFLYNLFIFISLKNRSYLFYVLYLLGIIVFMASNGGYLLEFIIPNHPTLDIYIRFISVPIVLQFYLLFGDTFLKIKKYLPKFHVIIKGLIILLGIITILMLSGFWMLGRSLNIFLAVPCFLILLIMSVLVYRKGYTPAKYYLAANFLLLLGGIVFAVEKTSFVVHNPLTQYSLQISMVLEVTLFSIGLADKINLTRRQLAEQTLEKERLEREQIEERRKIIQQKNEELEVKVKERTAEVVAQKEEIEQKNKNITDSIRYAQRIQNAILGGEEIVKKRFETTFDQKAFIFFQPKDIVSGDFYWYSEVEDERGVLKKVIIAADCTGHGVPGAFMTVMGSALLNEIVNTDKITEPSEILSKLDGKLTQALHQKDSDYKANDGMDMTVITVDDQELLFAGAKNPLYYVRDGKIDRLKGDTFPIGSTQYETKKVFTSHRFEVQKGDMYYIFSDGYQDQFGGEKGRKFMSKKFRLFLEEISELPLSQQHQMLDQTLLEWKGDLKQTDDILVIGIKL